MRMLIIPVSALSGKKWASERFRCDWVLPYLDAVKYTGHEDPEKFDAIVYQKALIPGLAEKMRHKVQVFDATDPMWLWCDYEVMGRFIDNMDVVTVSSPGLKLNFEQYYQKPCEYIPDGHNLEYYKERKVHKPTDRPIFVWFGYAGNFSAMVPLLPAIREYRLIVIAEKRVMNGRFDFIPWDFDTVNKDIIKGDIVLNPPDQGLLKSNNKTVSAWALGMPVAHNVDEVERFKRYEERVKESEKRLEQIDNYHARHSAKELERIIRGVKKA